MLRRPALLLIAVTIVFTSALAIRADEPAQKPDVEFGEPVSLFDRSTLAGWDYGNPDRAGWSMNDGVLSEHDARSRLLSGWTVSDFALEFDWTVTAGSGWILRMFDVVQQRYHAIILAEVGSEMPEASSFTKIGGSASKLEVAPAKTHHAVIRCVSGLVTVHCDGTASGSARFDGPVRWGFEWMTVGEGPCTLSNMRLREPKGKPIFNGRDTAGWWTPGNLASWPVIDGELVCINQKGDYLRTEKEYANFLLTFEYKMAKGGNSGVGIRTSLEGWPSGNGMELQLLDERPDTPLNRHSTMSIYGRLEPLTRADRSNEWNRVAIKAEGRMITAWINGVLVQQTDTGDLPDLKHRPLQGWIGLQDHGARTQFRDIRVLELPDNAGVGIWTDERPRLASKLVIDRLMNTDTLAQPDGCGSGVVHARTEGAGEKVLADLKGPGAIVSVVRSSDRGSLSCYLDGSDKPAFECPAAELARHVPVLGPDTQPLLVYIPYRKSLKLVVRDAPIASYTIEYVTFPDDVVIDTFAGPDRTTERGWIPSLTRRYEETGFGNHREFDGTQVLTTGMQTVEAKSSLPALEVAGAGTGNWIKLKVSNKVLARDDLWLVVHVDGEETPAIEAPARFFFPGLINGGKYRNFVVTQRNGNTNLLSQPFTKGWKVKLENRGKKPIKDVELSIGFLKLDDQARVAPGRLRARYAKTLDKPMKFVGVAGHVIAVMSGTTDDGQSSKLRLLTDGSQAALTTGADTLPAADGWLETTGLKYPFRTALCGAADHLAWHWLLLTPAGFAQNVELQAEGELAPGGVMLWAYIWPDEAMLMSLAPKSQPGAQGPLTPGPSPTRGEGVRRRA